jgi:hypothetical protein
LNDIRMFVAAPANTENRIGGCREPLRSHRSVPAGRNAQDA